MKELYCKTYRFAQYQLDPTRRRLLCAGKRVALNAKAFDLLVALVEQSGQVMSKDELMNRVWQEQFVEEANLAVQVSALRRVLGKSPDEQPFIVTVPGRGYSFVAEVHAEEAQAEVIVESQTTSQILIEEEIVIAEPARAGDKTYQSPLALNGEEIHPVLFEASQRTDQAPITTVTPATSAAPQKPAALNRRRLVRITALIVLAISGLTAVWLFRSRNQPRQNDASLSSRQLTVRRFTTQGGVPHRVAISPDGKSLIYLQRFNGKNSLWLGQIETNNSVPIYQKPDLTTTNPTFAPDGNSVYFVVKGDDRPQAMLVRMPIFGGVMTELIQHIDSAPALSPDSKQLAFLRNETRGNQRSIIIADAADGRNERTLITRKSPGNFSGEGLSWSPDGKSIAIGASNANGRDEILQINVANGSSNKIGNRDWGKVDNVAWLPDGNHLAVIARETIGERLRHIWLVSYPGGEVRQITNDLNTFLLGHLSVSADGKLAVLQGQVNAEIWIAPNADVREAHRVLQGVAPRYEGIDGLAWMPDGRLLYTAYVGDSMVIWTMNSDGSNLQQLTPAKAYASDGMISVTADGRYVVFQSSRSGAMEIWRVNTDGSNLKQLTTGGNNSLPSPSLDGQWIIYTATVDGKTTLWRVSIDGGEAQQLTYKSVVSSKVSPDGRYIACTIPSEGSDVRLTIYPFEGGEVVKSFAVPPTALQGKQRFCWMPDSKAILYNDHQGLWRQALDEEKPQPVKGFEAIMLRNLAWSFDGRQFAYTSGATTQEIILIENFR